MRILRQVVAEAMGSLRRSPAVSPQSHRDEETSVSATRARESTSSGSSSSGIRTVILSWKDGENDPFTVVSETIRQHLHACGKNVEIVELTRADWTERIVELAAAGIEFAFTWQGLGSNVTIAADGTNLWERLKIPLICLHGDHPSHMPRNHQLDTRYCIHLYANADAARYSNRHFRRSTGASVIDIPQLHREQPLLTKSGDYFVFAKNINDPLEMERSWQQSLDKRSFDFYMTSVEILKSRIAHEPDIEIHDVLDDTIRQYAGDWLDPLTNTGEYHRYHSWIDHFVRSFKAVSIVASIREFPVHIYGRGWDRIADNASVHHRFERGRNMADSQSLFYTKFGILDVSPSKGLHDRTRRAMANRTAFLSSANLDDSFADVDEFAPLFFNFCPNDLSNKCSLAVSDPDTHLEMSRRFASIYDSRHYHRDFVQRIDLLAKAISRA